MFQYKSNFNVRIESTAIASQIFKGNKYYKFIYVGKILNINQQVYKSTYISSNITITKRE